MAFKKGESGNPEGRPAGSKNKMKTDDELRDDIGGFIKEKLPVLFRKFDKLSFDHQRKLIKDLMPYYLATLQSTKTTINFEDFTDAQLDEIIEKLTKSVQDE